MRAWNEVPTEDRRLPVGREFFHMENEGGRLGYDLVPGREGRIAINDYDNVDEDLANLVIALRDANRLCHVQEESEEVQEPQIICSLGLFVPGA